MDVVKRVKIVIPVIPESQNAVLRMNRYERHRALQEKAALIKWYCKERPDKPFQKAHVSIKYYFPDRCRRDPDNYTGGSGTVSMVAMQEGRNSIYIDLNREYLDIALRRCGFDGSKLIFDQYEVKEV